MPILRELPKSWQQSPYTANTGMSRRPENRSWRKSLRNEDMPEAPIPARIGALARLEVKRASRETAEFKMHILC